MGDAAYAKSRGAGWAHPLDKKAPGFRPFDGFWSVLVFLHIPQEPRLKLFSSL